MVQIEQSIATLKCEKYAFEEVIYCHFSILIDLWRMTSLFFSNIPSKMFYVLFKYKMWQSYFITKTIQHVFFETLSRNQTKIFFMFKYNVVFFQFLLQLKRRRETHQC